MSKKTTSKAPVKTSKKTAPPPKAEAPNVRTNELAKPYFAGIDILKLLAAFFVVWVHTFLYNGFYYAEINDEKYIAPIACRWIAYTCVPIFMTITGYLMKNKKLSGKYYLGILRVVTIYLFISVLCMRSNHKWFNTQFTPWSVLKGYLEYSNATYGWYVNYYIALFCLIPFLNLAFNGLENRKQRFALVATISIFTIFARSLYIGFDRSTQSKLFPDYLQGMWPLAYYYVGAYIREYPPKKCLRNKFLIFCVLVASIAFLTQSTYIQSIDNVAENRRFLSWHFNDYGTYPVFIAAICIFLLFFDITTTSKKVKFVLRQLGDATFALYLISYVFDREIYPKFVNKYPPAADGTWNFSRFTHSYESLFYTFFHALFWALVIQNAYNLIEYLIKLAIRKFNEMPSAENSTSEVSAKK